MYVHPVAESLGEVGVTAQMGHDAQLDLGIVGTDNEAVRNARNKGFANLLSALRTHRNVLQVGIGTGQAAGGRKGLVEGGVHPAVLLRNIRREGLYVSGQQFLDRPEFQNLIHYGMPVRYGHQRGFVGGILALVAALFGLGVQLEFVKQKVSHLLGGGNVEGGLIGHFPDAGLAFREFFAQVIGKDPELRHIHLDAVPFHLRQYLGQRLFHGVVEGRKVFPEFVTQRNEYSRFLQTRGVVFLGNLVKEGSRLYRGRCFFQRYPQICLRQGGQFVAALRIQHIVHELDVVPLAFQAYPFLCQRVGHLLKIHPVFGNGGIM